MKCFLIILAAGVLTVSGINQVIITSLEQALETLAQLANQAQAGSPSNASLENQLIINALKEHFSQSELLTLEECALLLAELARLELALGAPTTSLTLTTTIYTEK